MRLSQILKAWVIGLTLVFVQACGSTPAVKVPNIFKKSDQESSQGTSQKPGQKSSHVKTKIPPPFPVTTQSLRGERIDALLMELVKEGSVPGLSVLIYEGDTETYFGATGYSNIDAKTPLRRSDVGRYYSMTKPITGVAMMMLYEQGKFELDDPVAKYLPEYSEMMVYDGENEDGSLNFAPAENQITIRDLMRHTSGMTYGFIDTPIDHMYNKNGILTYDQTVAQFSENLAELPLLYQPGAQYNYGVSTDIQGRLIEVLSGQSLGTFFEVNIFTPLGMNHTGFKVNATDRAKFGAVYARGKDGLFALHDGDPRIPLGLIVDEPFLGDLAYESGGGGLVSSIDDYAKFALMLQRNDGTLIKPETLDLMTTDQLGSIPNGDLGEGSSFGLNFALKMTPQNSGAYSVPKGTFYWGGMAGTAFFIDDKNDLTFLMHMQVMTPNFLDLRKRMAAAVYGQTQ